MKLGDLFRFIWSTLDHSDVNGQVEPLWYRRGNVLLAHTMLGVMTSTVMVALLPATWLVQTIVILSVAYAVFKEGRDLANNLSWTTLVDCVVDIKAVAIGLAIPAILVHNPILVLILVGTVALLWFRYPFEAFIHQNDD